ncbi:GTP-binding protein [uncultured Pseudodesulfovibrio sp.]|uniref:CobW family GTP-binding protein n=1 Tax=uncultured Pseudodesulfovibrio sp. TaxID=2035858 RepID=UPI0029C9A615|nr:GTP-binding protein [uncultured Pseudodesulfovibrio sp.]
MSIALKTLLPPALTHDPALVATELPRALMTRANFIPGVRHRLGWRGVRDCAKGKGGLTVKITGMAGVYGLEFLTNNQNGGTGRASFYISYFPAPDEELVESFSVQAGIAAQADDYLDRVREFTLHHDLRALFSIAVLDAYFMPESQGIALSLSAPELDTIMAMDGVTVETPNGPVQAVAPGNADQNLPAWDTALPLFNALAASASYCLGMPPQSLTRHTEPGSRRFYGDMVELHARLAPDLRSTRLGLSWDTTVPDDPNFTTPDISWAAPNPLPAEYADAPWTTADLPGAANSLDKRTMGITDRPRLIVLTGFLGSGKTTFLARFIEEQAAKNGFVAVVQNEIGQKGLDGKLLGQSYAVTEVDEGCVCCTLAGSLRSALSGIMSEFQPDFVVLETTGLANPANLLTEIADLDDLLDFASVTTLLDASCAPRALVDYEVARSQVRLADILLLNKTDLADEKELHDLEARIRELNPTADLHRVVNGDIPAATLYGVNFRKSLNRPAPHLAPMGMHATHGDDDIQSALITLDTPLDRETFRRGVAGLPDQVLRAKGVVQFSDTSEPEIFQYVPGSHALTPADEHTEERFLVIIGREAPSVARDFRSAIGI